MFSTGNIFLCCWSLNSSRFVFFFENERILFSSSFSWFFLSFFFLSDILTTTEFLRYNLESSLFIYWDLKQIHILSWFLEFIHFFLVELNFVFFFSLLLFLLHIEKFKNMVKTMKTMEDDGREIQPEEQLVNRNEKWKKNCNFKA